MNTLGVLGAATVTGRDAGPYNEGVRRAYERASVFISNLLVSHDMHFNQVHTKNACAVDGKTGVHLNRCRDDGREVIHAKPCICNDGLRRYGDAQIGLKVFCVPDNVRLTW